MQSKLDAYFGTKCLVPDNFCLDLENNKAMCQMKIGGNKILTKRIRVDRWDFQIEICSSTCANNVHKFDPKHSFNQNAVPFLKSLLQKSIRRGFLQHALFACYVLLELDPFVLFRRLCIIMIEDVTLHIGFTVLAWYMLAQQSPSQECVEWMLGLVKWLCETSNTIYFETYDGSNYPRPCLDDSLSWSLLFRKAYGGLKGDLDMLDKLVVMLNRGHIRGREDSISRIHPEVVACPGIWMYDAIDFHVHPLILHIGDFDSQEIKKMMWFNSSGVNRRKQTIPYRLEDWKSISWKVRNIQIEYFNTILKTML